MCYSLIIILLWRPCSFLANSQNFFTQLVKIHLDANDRSSSIFIFKNKSSHWSQKKVNLFSLKICQVDILKTQKGLIKRAKKAAVRNLQLNDQIVGIHTNIFKWRSSKLKTQIDLLRSGQFAFF